MYFCDEGIVLRQRALRDNDKIVSIFTRGKGRLEVNFKGVRRPKAKLRALSETFVYGDYRFYLKRNSNFPVCTGGKVFSVFPKLRESAKKISAAFFMSELLLKITPLAHPAEEKFNLLLCGLKHLNSAEKLYRSFLISYALILLDYSGVGFRETNIGLNSSLWNSLHDPSFSRIMELEQKTDPAALNSAAEAAIKKIIEHTDREISTLKFVKIYE